MKIIIKIITATIFVMTTALAVSENSEITGAGSSFVYPVMVKWTRAYSIARGINVNYQSIGSGGGIRQLNAKTIDFAASDEPLTTTKLNQAQWQQYPIVMGGIIPVVNIAGIKNGELVLTGSLLADIYLGNVRYWDAPAIKAVNPALTLPHTSIIPVYRADSSGTTYNFTYYLSQVSPAWKSKAHYATNISWPVGIGGKGNAGVAAQVIQLSNSIGYVEYAYITNGRLTYVSMKNRSGQTVKPTLAAFKAGVSATVGKQQPDKALPMMMTNPMGSASWPIMATTFVMIPQGLPNNREKKVRDFVSWCYQRGGSMAQTLGYVPIPAQRYQPMIANW